MDIEQIQKFLSVPELPDIVGYILIIIGYALYFFIKAFVKKDNRNTLTNITIKTAELKSIKADMENCQTLLIEERNKWDNERRKMQKEINTLKHAIRTSSNNSKELVSNGTANHVAKMLPLTEEDKKVIFEEESHSGE